MAATAGFEKATVRLRRFRTMEKGDNLHLRGNGEEWRLPERKKSPGESGKDK
jgi:hypothetical protein